MKQIFGPYKGWMLLLIPKWNDGRTAFFVVGPGPDPKLIQGDRDTYDQAKIAGRKTIRHEADYYESRSRSNS
jgi:hypothetical protein